MAVPRLISPDDEQSIVTTANTRPEALGRPFTRWSVVGAVNALVGIDSVTRLIKVGGFVASASDFTDQAEVLNGASSLLHEIFGEAGVTRGLRSGWRHFR